MAADDYHALDNPVKRRKRKKKVATPEQVHAAYLRLKQFYSKYYQFSFRNPRKGKTFTPAQKSVITRIANKLAPLVESVAREHATWIPTYRIKDKKSIPQHDGVKTNKGFFYKYGGASIKTVTFRNFKNEKVKKSFIYIDYSKIGNGESPLKEIYVKFPPSVLTSFDRVQEFVNTLWALWNPDYIKLSAWGRRYATQMDIREFFQGSGRETLKQTDDEEKTRGQEENYFGGVLVGWIVD